MATKRLGVGIIGSGFNARFHLQAWRGVRDADVLGVWSPTATNARDLAGLARTLDVGAAKPYSSITAMIADPAIDALWLCGANFARVENMEEIADAVIRAKGKLVGVACEKPLARNAAEARRMVELAAHCGVKHGYLENQVFAPPVAQGKHLLWTRGAAHAGRPYLARAAEEHAGPHRPWFWRGDLQGGGVLNDMMCHSALVVRFLLTRPGESLASLRPARVTSRIASLKWTRPEYARRLSDTMGDAVNYASQPAEDFASLTVEFATEDGHQVFGEATTSWSYVGAGLRLSAELLGPEYSMSWNSLDSGLHVFFSRAIQNTAGEDLVEKQNAESGLMPVVANEPAAYGYEAENRHFVRAFLGHEEPLLTWEDGLDVVRILMTAYQSAEQDRTIAFPPPGLDEFVPAVARGAWNPRQGPGGR